jgi:pimeloyl-ACP methyl ester carboxylesterase
MRLVVLTVAISGCAFVTQGVCADAPTQLVTDLAYAKPQRLVEVEHGRRMNIYCLGAGSPTVVMDSGLGDSTISWALVQPQIAKSTKTCTYDRAGLGFSDPAARPSTVANMAHDLHALLKAAKVKPPYILVGHSLAGMTVRVYADRYREDVVGMVIVDGSHEDQSVRVWGEVNPAGRQKWEAYLAEHSDCVGEAETGLVKGTAAYQKCIGDDDPHLSPAINEAQDRVAQTPRWQAAVASERQSIFRESADQTRATRKDFGDMPIIVLTHQPQPPSDDETPEQQDRRTLIWEDLHNQVAAMSTRGINAVVPHADHYIQFDRPQVVVDAVNQAIFIAREAAHSSGTGRVSAH